MLATLGVLAIIASFAVSTINIVLSAAAIRRRDDRLVQTVRYGLYSNFFFLAAALICLLGALYRTDLQVFYVVNHSSATTDPFYKLTSLWAGSSGSYLFWNFLNAAFTALYVFMNRHRPKGEMPYSFLVLAIIAAFFSFIGAFFHDAQPFRTLSEPMAIGRGLNPLLLHWAMIIHPPILYVGYVSFSIPFAIAMGGLLAGRLDADWLKTIRRWSLFSWFFLGTGICLGMKWAYEELGWGGYWAWDPVENASFMPWLFCTAFIHSIIVQERRGMLKLWNVVLMHLTYHFTLLGTWITRSGILDGPHSFANAEFGIPFIIFIIISAGVYLAIIVDRRHVLVSEAKLESLTSKETGFLLNNLVLLLIALMIFAAVMTEPVTKWINSYDPSVEVIIRKQAWYNSYVVPFGLLVFFLMGLGPLLSWRRTTLKGFYNSILWPLSAGVAGVFAAPFLYAYFKPGLSYGQLLGDNTGGCITVGIVVLVFTGTLQELYRGYRARRTGFPQESPWRSGVLFIVRNKRRYVGYIVHIGLAIMFLGFSGRAVEENTKLTFFMQKPTLSMQARSGKDISGLVFADGNVVPEKTGDAGRENNARFAVVYGSETGVGDKQYWRGYTLEARRLVLEPEFPQRNLNAGIRTPNVEARIHLRGDFILHKGDETLGVLTSWRTFHPQVDPGSAAMQGSQPSSHPAIHNLWLEDYYVQLGSILDLNKDKNPDLERIMRNINYAPNEEAWRAAVDQLPESVEITARVWLNPLIKLVWIGAVFLGLSTLLIIIPAGEKKNFTI